MDRNLILDIGLHKGIDAEFYLSKGFRVVGLEARHDLCALCAERYADAVAKGDLKIVEAALFDEADSEISFFINPDKDDWGSIFVGIAEKGVGSSYEVKVKTTTLMDIVSQYGVPYYAKCDIEGADEIFARQLVALNEKPLYISMEVTKPDDIDPLPVAGYQKFQIVNQWLHPFTVAPSPSREGKTVPSAFTHESSGLFGLDLPDGGWLTFSEAKARVSAWHALRAKDPNLAIGWLDIHATID